MVLYRAKRCGVGSHAVGGMAVECWDAEGAWRHAHDGAGMRGSVKGVVNAAAPTQSS